MKTLLPLTKVQLLHRETDNYNKELFIHRAIPGLYIILLPYAYDNVTGIRPYHLVLTLNPPFELGKLLELELYAKKREST